MKVRFENRDKFKVCGYVTETNRENDAHDVEQLWTKHENELRKIPESKSCLYGVIWYTDDAHQQFCYLLGVEADIPHDDMVCVEIPTGHFAVATVPEKMAGTEAWTEFFFKEIPEKGFMPDESHGFYFEFYYENGNYELWTPVKPVDN